MPEDKINKDPKPFDILKEAERIAEGKSAIEAEANEIVAGAQPPDLKKSFADTYKELTKVQDKAIVQLAGEKAKPLLDKIAQVKTEDRSNLWSEQEIALSRVKVDVLNTYLEIAHLFPQDLQKYKEGKQVS